MKNLFAMLLLALMVSVAAPQTFAEGMGVDENSYLNDMPEDEFVEGEDEDAGYIDEVERVEDDIRHSRDNAGNRDSRNPDAEW